MSLSKTVTEYAPFPGSRVFIAPTKAKDVVTIIGSVFGGENMLPIKIQEAAGMAAELMDAGTSTKSKDVIRDSLASRGASVSFNAGGDRFHFSASCLPEDLSFVLKTITECMHDAAFPVAEIKTAKERLHGDLVEEKTDTRTQGSEALTRLLYGPKHVNYAAPTTTRIKEAAEITRTNLLTYRSLLGKGGLVLSIVGDVNVTETMSAVTKAFKMLGKGTEAASIKAPNLKSPAGIEQKISIADKTNIDVYLGAPVPVTTQSTDYLPFVLLTNMLGGAGFTNHLMQTLRERDSLTYVAYAYPAGFQEGTTGYFKVWTAFSPELYDNAILALRKEVDFFFTKGITAEALRTHQERMTGTSVIRLSTTKGLASALHAIGVENKELSYIDSYPELIRAVTLEDVKRVAALIPLGKLSIAAAGTFRQ